MHILWSAYIDWCYFYYFARNSLVALLETPFARTFLDLRSRCAVTKISISVHTYTYTFPVCISGVGPGSWTSRRQIHIFDAETEHFFQDWLLLERVPRLQNTLHMRVCQGPGREGHTITLNFHWESNTGQNAVWPMWEHMVFKLCTCLFFFW